MRGELYSPGSQPFFGNQAHPAIIRFYNVPIGRTGLFPGEFFTMQKVYRVGVIGRTGKGDYGHALDLAFNGIENIACIAVADEDPEGLRQAGERIGAQHLYADYRDMLDKEKISVKTFAKISKMNAQALVTMKWTMDENGTKYVKEVPVVSEKSSTLWWWRIFGILDEHHRTKGDYRLTKVGEDVAYERVRKEIDAAVSTSGEIVSLPQLAKEHPSIPPSLIVRFLKEEELAGNAKESSENIFWFRPAAAANTDNIYKMRVMAYQYVNNVRYIMSKVWHDYTRHGIMDILFKEKYGYGVFVSKRLCDLVEKLSGVKVEEVNSEITWHFPLDQRILYLFRQYPTAMLTVEQIKARIVIPGGYLGQLEEMRLIREALESLRQKNMVKESGGKWSLINT